MFFKRYNYDSLVKSIIDTQLAREEFRYKPSEVALLVIDVQSEFCDPDKPRGNGETYYISKKIKSIIPAFRKASIPVYAIYMTETKSEDLDFYKFVPEANDIIIRKPEPCAFKNSYPDLKTSLKRNGIKTIIACGFNKNGCVRETLVAARRKGFNAFLLEDLSGNDNENRSNSVLHRPNSIANDEMEFYNVKFINSTQLLKDIKVRRPKGIKLNV